MAGCNWLYVAIFKSTVNRLISIIILSLLSSAEVSALWDGNPVVDSNSSMQGSPNHLSLSLRILFCEDSNTVLDNLFV